MAPLSDWLPCKDLVTIYTAVVRPCLEYGSVLLVGCKKKSCCTAGEGAKVSPSVSLCSQCPPVCLCFCSCLCVCGCGPPFLVLLVSCLALPTHLSRISSSPHPVCSPASHSVISHSPYISVPFPLFFVSLSVFHPVLSVSQFCHALQLLYSWVPVSPVPASKPSI